jgi:DNA adenine methylase
MCVGINKISNIYMRYLGGKHKIGEKISSFIAYHSPPSEKINGYLEPFCGSLGVFKYMIGLSNYSKYIASDIQPDLMQLWNELKTDKLEIPTDFTQKEYDELKYSKSTAPNSKRAIAGFFLSFGGKYFGGYAQKWVTKKDRNYLHTFINNANKLKPILSGENVEFYQKSYLDWNPKNMVIYCDPPYQGTEGYAANNGEFDHELFWETMRKWSKNNTVFISEQRSPADFISVWSLSKKRTLSTNTKSRKMKKEHLFVYKDSDFYRNFILHKPQTSPVTKKYKYVLQKHNKTRKKDKIM